MKKSLVLYLFLLVLSLSFISAAGDKMGITTSKDSYLAGETISIKVSLYDSYDSPIDTTVNLAVEDAEKRYQIERTATTNKFVDVELGNDSYAGYWKLTAKYQNPASGETAEASALFLISLNDLAKFELVDGTLIVTNIGNTKYSKTVQIVIGDTVGIKNVDLNIGEKISFRLLAPAGSYSVKVSDGKTSLITESASLTGNVIGILDDKAKTSSPLTSGRTDGLGAQTKTSVWSIIKGQSFVYIFVMVVFGAAILLVIERRYRRKVLDN